MPPGPAALSGTSAAPPAAPVAHAAHVTEEFQYLTVLVSIILGLGITQLLTSVGRLAQSRARVRHYWPAEVWVVLLFLIHVQSWWAIYSVRDYPAWTFLGFVVVLLTPVSLYLMAALVLPEVDARGGELIDLRAHYHAQARWFFAAAAAVVAASFLRSLVLVGRLPLDLDRAIQCVFLVLAGAAVVVRGEAFHRLLAVSVAGLYAAYVALLFTRLQ